MSCWCSKTPCCSNNSFGTPQTPKSSFPSGIKNAMNYIPHSPEQRFILPHEFRDPTGKNWHILLLKINKLSGSLFNLLVHPNFYCFPSFSCRSVQHKLISAQSISNIPSQCSVDNKPSLFPYSNVRGMGSALILDASCAIKSNFHLRRWTWK